jgi:MFS family permease
MPFVVRDQLGGDSTMFGFLLAVMGIGSAAAALVTASFKLPRRYLTVMMVSWGAGSLPLAAVGLMDNFWVLALALFVFGATGSVGMVIWGTLLQRRVPAHLLGRISSLDFFVSLALMPLSMALAGPVSAVLPLWIIFLVAGSVCPVVAIVAMLAARMTGDEITHPLERQHGISADADVKRRRQSLRPAARNGQPAGLAHQARARTTGRLAVGGPLGKTDGSGTSTGSRATRTESAPTE